LEFTDKQHQWIAWILALLVFLAGMGVLFLAMCKGKRRPVGLDGPVLKGVAVSRKGAIHGERKSPGEKPAGDFSRKKIEVDAGGVLRLVAVDTMGNPLPGAKVSLVEKGGRKEALRPKLLGETGARGDFLLRKGVFQGGNCILVRKEGFQAGVLRGGNKKDHPKGEVRVVLEPGFQALFQAFTPDNFPVPGVKVAVSGRYIPAGFLAGGVALKGLCTGKNLVFLGKTDEAGEVRFDGLPKGLLFLDVYKDGYGVLDIRPKPPVIPGGPFKLTLSRLYIAIGKVEGLKTYCCFSRPPRGFCANIIMGSPCQWIENKFPGCFFTLGSAGYVSGPEGSSLPKTIPAFFLVEKLGWKKVDLPVQPFSRERALDVKVIKYDAKRIKDNLGYVVLRPKVNGEDLFRLPPMPFSIEPIRLARPEERPNAGLPFGFLVVVEPRKKTGLPEGEYKLSSYVPFVKKMIPTGFKIVAVRGETRVYDIYLEYEYVPVFFRFYYPGGGYKDSGILRMKIPGLGSQTERISSSEPLWLPCTEIQCSYDPFDSMDPVRKKVNFKVKIKGKKDGSPTIVEIRVPRER